MEGRLHLQGNIFVCLISIFGVLNIINNRNSISTLKKKKNKFDDPEADLIQSDTTEKLLVKKVNGRVERIRAAFKNLDGDK